MVTLVIRISYFTTCSIPAVEDMSEKKRTAFWTLDFDFYRWQSFSGASNDRKHSLQPVHPPVERTFTFLRSLIKRDKDERYDSDLERSLHPRTHLLSSRFLRAAPSKAAKWLRPGHGPRTCVHIAPAPIHLFYLLLSRFFLPACIFYAY